MKKNIRKMIFAMSAFFALSLFATPQKVIYDTDMGNDVDDALALAMLYDYCAARKADVSAILINKDNVYAPIFTNLLNTYYGFNFPIGIVSKNGVAPHDGKYIGKISDMLADDGSYIYPRALEKTSKPIDAVKLARKVLSESEDGSIVYISVGFSTNIARLFKSPADEISPLSGLELVRKKVKYFSVMAGQFGVNDRVKKYFPEFNIKYDVDAAREFFAASPVPIIFSGFEVGELIGFPKEDILKNLSEKNPLTVAYKLYAVTRAGKLYDTRTWDLTSVLFVFSPEFFDISEKGIATVDSENIVRFNPSKDGNHRYLILPKDGAKKIAKELSARVTTLKPKAETK